MAASSPTDRPGNHRTEHAHYGGKHRATGLLAFGLTDQAGNLLWVSAAVAPHRRDHSRPPLPARPRPHEQLGLICDLGFTTLGDQPDTTRP